MQWPQDTVPQTISIPDVVSACFPSSQIIQSLAGLSLRDVLSKAGILNTDGSVPWESTWIAKAKTGYSWLDSIISFVIGAFAELEVQVIDNLERQVSTLALASGCQTSDIIPVAIAQTLIGFVREWIVDIHPALTAPWDYYANWACPVRMPTEGWANEAYARTFITDEEWKCLIRSNGQLEKWQEIDVRMRGKQPTEDQLLLLWRKGYFDKDEDFYKAMNILGWVDTNSIAIYVAAQAWIPSPTDAIDWMIKDVSDPVIQEAFGLSAEFTLKYQGATKDALDYNGISQADALNLWRSHWRNMAPTTLYELHKRLRPGWIDLWTDEEVTEFVAAICPAARATVDAAYLASRPVINGFPVPTFCNELPDVITQRRWLNSLVTTGFDVSEALGQADYPAVWRARLLALSYKVMTRVDVRRAYETGQLNELQAVGKFQDQGYSPPDSQVLIGFYRQSAIQLHARKPVCNQWVKTGYDINLLRQSLISQGMRPDMWPDVSGILITRRKISIQQECMEGIHKRFVKGIIDDAGARTELLGMNFPLDQVNDVVSEWQCIQAAKPRSETAAEICQEFQAGLISGKEAQRMLRALGYTAPAARRILALCYLRIPSKSRRPAPLPGSPAANAMNAALDGGI